MPVDWSKYSPFWKSIRAHILERAANRCEFCGVANHALIIRSTIDPARYIRYDEDKDCHYTMDGTAIRLSEIPGEFEFDWNGNHRPMIKVVLTIAHLDHDTTNNADDNLRALCQRCHLKHDARQHAERAAETRRMKFEDRQPMLPGINE